MVTLGATGVGLAQELAGGQAAGLVRVGVQSQRVRSERVAARAQAEDQRRGAELVDDDADVGPGLAAGVAGLPAGDAGDGREIAEDECVDRLTVVEAVAVPEDICGEVGEGRRSLQRQTPGDTQRARVTDLRTLARWFAQAGSEAEAHRLWRAAFGLSPARRLRVDADTQDVWQSVGASANTPWAAAPPLHVRRGRPENVADHSAEKSFLAAELFRLALLDAAPHEVAYLADLRATGLLRRLCPGPIETARELLAVALGDAPLVDRVDRAEQRRDRRERPPAQDLRLRGRVGLGDEPSPQALPAPLSGEPRLGALLFGHLEQVGDVAVRGGLEHAMQELADEAVQVVDQGALVGEEAVELRVTQVDRPLKAADERLRAARQFLESVTEGAQAEVDLGGVELGRGRQREQFAEQAADVAQGDGLQLAGPAQRVVVGSFRVLGRWLMHVDGYGAMTSACAPGTLGRSRA